MLEGRGLKAPTAEGPPPGLQVRDPAKPPLRGVAIGMQKGAIPQPSAFRSASPKAAPGDGSEPASASKMLSGIGAVTGLDIDPDVKNNRWLSNAFRRSCPNKRDLNPDRPVLITALFSPDAAVCAKQFAIDPVEQHPTAFG